MEVDITKCIDCSLCERICPTKSIIKVFNKYVFSDTCAACLRCYSQCPESAILFGDKNSDTKKYPRYKGSTGYLKSLISK